MSVLFLTDADVAAALTPAEVLDSQRSAYRAVVDGRGSMLAWAHARDETSDAVVYTRTGRVADAPVVSVKSGMVLGQNPARGLPAVSAVMLLLDASSGRPMACLDARMLTLLRTSAGLAVAAEVLATPTSGRLGVLGSGPQAEHTVRMMAGVRPISTVVLWSPTESNREALASRLRAQLELEVIVAESGRQAVEGQEIVVACTASHEPVVRGEWLAAGQTVLTMGSVEVNRREVDLAATSRATTFVDAFMSARESCGPVVEALSTGRRDSDFTEIGAVLAGHHPGRTSPEEVIVFHSVGIGHQDATVGWALYRRALDAGLGTILDLGD